MVCPSLPSSDMARLDTILASLTTADPGSQLHQTLSAFLGSEVPLYSVIENLADTIATKIGHSQKLDAAYVLTKVVILESVRALEIGAGFTGMDLTGCTLDKILTIVEDIHKRLNIALDSPLKLALENFGNTVNQFKHRLIRRTVMEAEKMKDHAQHALTYIISQKTNLKNLKEASIAGILAMMGELMRTSYIEEKNTIQPFYLLTESKKSLIVNVMEKHINDIFDYGEKMEKSWFLTKKKRAKKQDAIDALLKVAYPFLTEGKGLTNSLAVIKAPYNLKLMPKFLPDGEEDRTSFIIGREDGISRIVEAWREKNLFVVMDWQGKKYYKPFADQEKDDIIQLKF